jgi:hypothetical protein
MDGPEAATRQARRRRVVMGLGIAAATAAFVPATADAGLIAAYDRFESGKGFEIRLVNVSTGAAISVPAGVNTTDDELHPTLTPDGRYLAFMRTKLQPKLNGDIVPPSARALHVLDRQTGTVTTPSSVGTGTGAAGPVFSLGGSVLAWGIKPGLNSQQRLEVSRHASFTNGALGGASSDIAGTTTAPSETPHAAVATVNEFDFNLNRNVARTARYLSFATIDANSGALLTGLAHIATTRVNDQGFNAGKSNSFGSDGAPASHPVPRSGDNYTALDLANGEDVDIQTLSWPTETTLTPAPVPITTTNPERMPAWSPDGIQLGFVRTIAGRRKLGVFDATPGIQNALNSPIDLGADAPTSQTRAYQSTWGGLALANSSALDVPTVICTSGCLLSLANSNLTQSVTLVPRLSSVTNVGIFVARVTGTRKLLGRTTPRIRVIGRVPLGRTRKGANRFRWNGKVNGKRLAAGTYLLTYRALRGKRVLSLSRSIRFTVRRSGRVSGVRAIRP